MHIYAQQQITVTSPQLGNQLPSNSVQRIFQDSEGFLWLGTKEGLCRYDAYRILNFRSGLKTPSLFESNEITCIAENRRGYILAGTKKGIHLIDKRTYRIDHVENNELKEQEIRSMIVDSKGQVWVGTLTSVLRYSPDFHLLRRYDDALPMTSINSIYEDRDGKVWVSLWTEGLYRYNPENDSFIACPKIGKRNNPFRIFQDNDKQHWICTWGNGVYRLYPDKEENVMYEPVIRDGNYFSITQDDKYGYLWLMSTTGLQALEKRAGNTVSNVDIGNIADRLNNIFSEIIRDRCGNLWIAAINDGVSIINFDKPPIHNLPLSSIRKQTGIVTNIQVVYEDKDGDYWIGQNRWGLGIYNPKKDEVLFYRDIPALKELSELANISCIADFQSVNGEYWIGTAYNNIIYGVKKEKETIRLSSVFDLKDCMDKPGNPVMFLEDSKKNCWIATTAGLLVKPFLQSEIMATGFLCNSITGMMEGRDGAIWIGSAEKGIYRLSVPEDFQVKQADIRNLTVSDRLISNNVTALHADGEGRIWMGSGKGHVFLYCPEDETVKNLSDEINAEEGILDILMDDIGHVWISTNKKIIEYNPQNGGKIDYSADDGVLINSFVQHSCFKTRLGEICYGGNRGISKFIPYRKLSEGPDTIQTCVVDVKLNGKSVLQAEKNEVFDFEKQALALKPNDKNLEIDFSSLNYVFPSKVRYAYKMEGVDDDWVYAGSNRQFAFYNRIPKGKRTFRMKATDVNGIWSSRISEISIYRTPAFYETWLAYTVYTILFLLSLYALYRRMKNRIQLRHELRIAQIEKEKSEELTQMKLRYFTNISHDLLTPLTIISCLIDDAEITCREKIPQLESIRNNANRLRRLFQQVLDFRKIEHGKMKLKISRGDIVAFIGNVCHVNFAPLMKKKKLDFRFISDADHLQACFDADKIDKVVSNLLSNACKHTGENGSVKVELTSLAKAGHTWLSVRVSDTGAGIAPADLKHIFTRFYTGQKNNVEEANGIGLSLCKDLLELHRGSISVESEPDKGAVFTVEIPIDKDSYSDFECDTEPSVICDSNLAPDSVAEETVDTEKDADIDDTRILFVEDNEELLYLMERIHSKHHKVVTAKNGREAMEIIKNNETDIVVSDVMMPEMDGLELCRAIKSDLETSHIPVILLTARNSVEDRVECYDAGADGYISKPFELKVLASRINNFIKHRKHQQKEFCSDMELHLDKLEPSTVDREFLDKIIQSIQADMQEPDFDVIRLASNLALSKSSLYRKLKLVTGLSPVEFIRNIRLKHGCRLLKEKQAMTVSEIAYDCGFSSPRYFSTCFKEEFKMTPKEYREMK